MGKSKLVLEALIRIIMLFIYQNCIYFRTVSRNYGTGDIQLLRGMQLLFVGRYQRSAKMIQTSSFGQDVFKLPTTYTY